MKRVAIRRDPSRPVGFRRRPADNHLTGDEWAEVLQRLLERSGGQCEGRTSACAAPGGSVLGMPREQVEIQHRRAQGMGGTALAEANSLANLLLLCGPCHRWVESRPSDPRGPEYPDLAEARGLWVRHEYRDGTPIPVEEYPLVLWSGRRVLLDPMVAMYRPHSDEWKCGLFSTRVAGTVSGMTEGKDVS